jgi:hypothetical protein
MNEILLVAGVVALLGAALGLLLVRGADFVPSQGSAESPSEAATAAA